VDEAVVAHIVKLYIIICL